MLNGRARRAVARPRRRQVDEVGAALVGEVPDPVEGVLGGAGDAQARQHRSDQADRQRDSAALQRVDVSWSWLPMIGNWPSVESEHAAEPGVPLQHEAEHRHEHEQQREQREEAVVGDQAASWLAPVVAELLEDRGDEAQPRSPLLAAVEARGGGR